MTIKITAERTFRTKMVSIYKISLLFTLYKHHTSFRTNYNIYVGRTFKTRLAVTLELSSIKITTSNDCPITDKNKSRVLLIHRSLDVNKYRTT